MATTGIIQYAPGISAGVDLSADQYCLVKLTGDRTVGICAATTDVPFGALQNDPTSGAEAAVAVGGIALVQAGGTIAAGARVGTDANGHAVALVEGTNTTDYVVGVAMQAAVSGDIFSVLLTGVPHRAA